MAVLFIGNRLSPLAVYRFGLISENVNKDCYFYDRGDKIIYTSDFRVIYSISPVFKKFSSRIFNPLHHFLSLWIAFKFCLNKKVELLFFHGVSVQLLALLPLILKLKSIAIPQGSDINQNYRGLHKIFTKLLLDNATIVTFKSLFMQKRLDEISSNKSKFYLNWGVKKIFEMECYFEEKITKKITIVSPRTNSSIYNINVIFSAISSLKNKGFDIHFIYVSLHERTNVDFDLSVADEVYYGLGDVQMSKLYDRSDIMISIPSYDGFSTSIIESMYRGVYPVISDLVSYKGEFEDDSRLVYKIKEIKPKILALALEEIIVNISDVRKYRENRRIFTEKNYSQYQQVQSLKKLFCNIGD